MREVPVRRPPPPRVPIVRRTIVALSWAAVWMLAWASALLLFSAKTRAETLSVAVSGGPVSLPLYVADARGFFKAEGVDVRLRDCRSGRECFGMLAEGGVDLATAAELLVTRASATRRDIAIIATISASSYQIKLVGRRSAHVAEAPQVRGKRIGTVAGTSAQYFLDNWLVFNDIDPRDVTVVPLAPERIVAALQERAVDAIAIWEPLASNAAALLGGDAIVFSSPRVYTQHFNLVTDRAALGRRAGDMVRLLRALVRAQRAIADDPAGARALLAARLGVPAERAGAWMAEEDYRVRLDQSLVTTMESQARWAALAAAASAPARGGAPVARGPDLLRAIEPDPLRHAAPEAVGLVH